jgi:acetylornithine deacetylase
MFININTMRAGDSLTSVPDSAEATGSLLFNPELTGAEVMAEIRETIDRVTAGDYWLREHPPLLDLPLDSASAAPWIKEPVNLPWDHPIVSTIQSAATAALGQTPDVDLSPFVCDANFWFPLGQECLVFGIGDPSWGIHGTNERLPVDDLINGVKAFAAVTMEWCGVE